SIDSKNNIKDGTEGVLSKSEAEHGRVLQLFETNELITLKDGVEEGKAELDDIEDNPKNLTFSPDYEPAFLPEVYESEEDVLVVINTNYAIGAGLDPVNDSNFREGDDSPDVNVLAVQEGKEDDAALNKQLERVSCEE